MDVEFLTFLSRVINNIRPSSVDVARPSSTVNWWWRMRCTFLLIYCCCHY